MKSWILAGILGMLIVPLPAQERVSWNLLQQAETPSGYIDFPQAVENLEGKEIEVKGYLIPIDAAAGSYALSAFPLAGCFFCGNAGPASVIELQLKEPEQYRIDDYRTFVGTLKLTPHPIGMVYVLESARETK